MKIYKIKLLIVIFAIILENKTRFIFKDLTASWDGESQQDTNK